MDTVYEEKVHICIFCLGSSFKKGEMMIYDCDDKCARHQNCVLDFMMFDGNVDRYYTQDLDNSCPKCRNMKALKKYRNRNKSILDRMLTTLVLSF